MTQCDEVGYFMLQNNADAFLYTGIALETYNTLVLTLEGYASDSFTMPVRDQLLMTFMKLKTNRVISDLSRQFHISQSMASKIMSYWIDKLEEVLRLLIPWLQYLVAVAPCGLIRFVSVAYGGRCSDKFITMDSEISDYDEVMADRGFTIKDLLFERKVRLVMPSFTKRRGQLTEEQVTYTRWIAHVRIHVKRAIRRLKVYKVLSQVVPISMVASYQLEWTYSTRISRSLHRTIKRNCVVMIRNHLRLKIDV